MPFQLGGFNVSELNATFSWGVSPASATVTMPGIAAVSAGDEVTLELATGFVFAGVVASGAVLSQDGRATTVQIVDNRVRLQWDMVYCSFNNSEVREDNPATPGVDRQKRFWHILPEDWDAQIKTWTDDAYTAKEVILRLLDAESVSFVWSVSFQSNGGGTSAQDKPVLGLDWNHGVKLGNALQEITDRQGLVFTLSNADTLKWARKGQGTLPTPPATSSTDRRSGDALGHNDTQVRIVGERNLYQDMPVTLEPVRTLKLLLLTMVFSKLLRKLSCKTPATVTAPLAVILS